MPQIPLDVYLSILSSASSEDNPFSNTEGAEALGEAFVQLAHGMVAFVNEARKLDNFGYEGARANLEVMVHTFPKAEAPLDPLEALLRAMAEGGDPFGDEKGEL